MIFIISKLFSFSRSRATNRRTTAKVPGTRRPAKKPETVILELSSDEENDDENSNKNVS